MKIAILEKTNFTTEQINKLKSYGTVDFYDSLTQDQANCLAPNYDIVVVNWLDPTPFLLDMKPGSLVALLSTGYGWISNLSEAREKNVLVSNIPAYSTEAVAEHLLGLLLGVTKNIFPTLNSKDNTIVGSELRNKTVGIIGLGNIGSRFAEILNFFGTKVITYNRRKKGSPLAEDVTLEELLETSDVICITCSVNNESRNLINLNNYEKIKKGAIIIGSTWDIVEEDALVKGINDNTISCVSFDAAIEGSGVLSKEFLDVSKDRIFLTPHIAYNTAESEKRQLDICLDNIVSFVSGIQKNIVN